MQLRKVDLAQTGIVLAPLAYLDRRLSRERLLKSWLDIVLEDTNQFGPRTTFFMV